ncbi:MAG: response regulator [Hyphomicrobiales bacterium]|nr:MAG: response regulator [Hyphomicrobiales bacterium]
MNSSPHILVVDDDREIRDLITRFLKKNGYRVESAANGREMQAALVAANIDLVVLDRVMPGEDGLELCRNLRKESRVPIILLTLLGSDTDRVVGLEMGADDYVTKPFNPQELLARIKAVLRRANELPVKASARAGRRVRFAGWVLDRVARDLTSPEGALTELTDGEFDLLVAFVEHPQIALTRDQLLDLTRGRSAIAFDRSIDMQMTRLRRKIERDPDQPELIKTIRNKGYIFTPDVTPVED